MTKRAAILILAAALAGCATTGGGRGGPSEVTRYHLGQPIAAGTVTVEPLSTNQTVSPEYQLYADAVAGELAKLGFQPAPQGSTSQYIAAVAFRRTDAGYVESPPPFSIGLGIGGASFGRRTGVGGGISTATGIGRGKRRAILATELAVQLRRRSDGTTIWEGRARRQGIERAGQPDSTADILAAALFKGFPGESGITISVP
ncbi:DUF4136 domain-containing protein [Sphingomonas cannabina]|uniref:DUF4136 domain-containing protein n=1 Tax=Sphingomonas cannabina TaxID=2899123 RepID=UPI001F19FFCD|nr:DUF4136 domain-containing protein [Sphingomonas cannabina]UIJ46428.1 DUF4136 domain-containing protein [Sphingomonas cannabina]